MCQSVLLSQFLLPLSAIKLGRFVTNINEPDGDYHDPGLDKIFNINEMVFTDCDTADTREVHRNFGTELISLLSSSVSKQAKTSIQITTKQVKTYYLDNNRQWFRDIVKSEEVREWIEQIIDEGQRIYVVVGYHTVLDARVTEQSREEEQFDGKLKIPVSSALAASGVIVPLGTLFDLGLIGTTGRAEDLQRHFLAQGEKIIAVQYRKVRFRFLDSFRFLSSKRVDKATLDQEARWKICNRTRYHQSDMEDMLEVALEDDLPLESNHEKYITGSGDVIFSKIGVNSEQ
jgi:hypothetical protein